MTYNYDFAVAGLVILSLILCHFNMHKHLNNIHTRLFKFLLTISIFDVILDITTTTLFGSKSLHLINLNILMLTIFYILQVLFPFTILCYIQSLKGRENNNLNKLLKKWGILPFIMIIIIFLNSSNGYLFYFDAYGNYQKGPYYLLTYYFTLMLVIIVIFDTIINFKKLGWRKLINIWEYLILAAVCVIMQAMNNHVLMTSFGIGLGMLILFMTINNPYEYMDSLTYTFNNQYFIDWLEELFANDQEFHIINVEITNLKKINFVFGNNIGNKFLTHFANKLRTLANDNAYIFRTNGKRFLVVTNSLASYQQLKKDIYELAANEFVINGEKFKVKIVVCGIFYANELLNVDNLVAYSDYLIHLVGNGDESILIQKDEKTMQGYMIDRKIEKFLSTSIENNNIELYFQPVYSLKAKKYISLEALSRLYHPALGYIPADKFIEMAERNGMILQLGLLQLHKICSFIKTNPSVLELVDNIKINLSPLQLMKSDYCQHMIEIIKSYDLECSFFQVEITETVATEYNAGLHRIIKELNNAGIMICLDDFGSGYANFNTVLKIPFSTVKLDRSLLFGICDNQKVSSFYRNISNSLIDMGYRVVAEGVETKKELELLKKWNIDYIQGYYFSKPVNEKMIIHILTDNVVSQNN